MKIEAEANVRLDKAAADRRHTRLKDATQQFESMLLQEMLKPMRSSKNSWLGEDGDLDAAAGTMSSFGTEAVATAISQRGGLGIARKVMEQVSDEAFQHAQKISFSTKV